MAISTVKPFPHVRINVKDNSVANVQIVETYPVHKPVYVMRAQEGVVGELVWCPTYEYAKTKFGAETFNPGNPTYFSKASRILMDTLQNNGAFIVRYIPKDDQYASTPDAEWLDAITSKYVLFAYVKQVAEIDQYEYQGDQRKLEFDSTSGEWKEKKSGTKEAGLSVAFGTRDLTGTETLTNLKPKAVEGGYEFPLLAFKAKNAGAYGKDVAFRLFYDSSQNEAGDISVYGSLRYCIGFGRREYNSTTVISAQDIFSREVVPFMINPDTKDPDSGKALDMASALNESFSDDTHVLPVDIVTYESNWNALGNLIAAYESELSLNGRDATNPVGTLTETERNTIKKVFFPEQDQTASEEEKAAVEKIILGYKVNVLSLIGPTDVPYDHVILADTIETGYRKTALTAVSYTHLEGGSDGTVIKDTDADHWASDDHAMYQFCNLTLPILRDNIVEVLRYPMTHIFDVGYSIRTKKAILDFLDVRQEVMTDLSTQVLMSDGSGRPVAETFDDLNDQAKDEAAVEVLRAYALLHRESVLFGTDCMRASIYCHAGILTNDDERTLTPFTYVSALWFSMYGNVDYMKEDEPRGLPRAYNTYFRKWNWSNRRLDSQSRVWDAGANYVQYADMKRLFYPSLRTVYRASSSVLIDEWFVAAICYAKYVVHETWAHYSGRNDYASELQGSMKSTLDRKLMHLFNNKYAFASSVYQTADEKEIGYVQHFRLAVEGHSTFRVADVDIITNRENFTTAEE